MEKRFEEKTFKECFRITIALGAGILTVFPFRFQIADFELRIFWVCLVCFVYLVFLVNQKDQRNKKKLNNLNLVNLNCRQLISP